MLDSVYRFRPGGNPEKGLLPANAVPASAFTTEDHTELRQMVYESADGSIISGVWECAPMAMDIQGYSTTEVMTVLSGSVTVTDGNGKPETFVSGDTFLIPKGANVTFEITETLRKYFLKVK